MAKVELDRVADILRSSMLAVCGNRVYVPKDGRVSVFDIKDLGAVVDIVNVESLDGLYGIGMRSWPKKRVDDTFNP